jgi:hypothetical protein
MKTELHQGEKENAKSTFSDTKGILDKTLKNILHDRELYGTGLQSGHMERARKGNQ